MAYFAQLDHAVKVEHLLLEVLDHEGSKDAKYAITVLYVMAYFAQLDHAVKAEHLLLEVVLTTREAKIHSYVQILSCST